MARKGASGIMLPLLLTTMLMLAFNIQLVKAEHELGETFFWDVYYSADELPDESERPWTLNKGFLSECASVSDGVLRLDTTSRNGYWYYKRYWIANSSTGVTVEARLKIEQSLGYGQLELNIADGAHAAMVEFYEDRVILFRVGEYFLNTTDDFHVYRVIAKENDIFLYIDDSLVLDGTGKFGYLSPGSRVLFGDGSYYGGGVLEGAISYWDYVAYTTKGAFAPLIIPASIDIDPQTPST